MKKYLIQIISVMFLLATCLTYVSAQDSVPAKDKAKKEQVKKDNKKPPQKKAPAKKSSKKKPAKKSSKGKQTKGKTVAKVHDKKADPKGKKQQKAEADSVE
jgi:hypothetical protein